MRFLKVALPLLLLGFLCPAAQPQGGNKYALIIGINDYLDNPAIPDLNFSVQDAELLAEAPWQSPRRSLRSQWQTGGWLRPGTRRSGLRPR